MNRDAEVQETVREAFAGVTLETPVAEAVRRGRQLVLRRRFARLAAGALVVAAVAGLAVAELHGGGGAVTAPRSRLAAWSVIKQPGGLVVVTINQLSDPAGLQRALRADGIPAAVNFQRGQIALTPPLPAECHDTGLSSEADASLQEEILVNPASLFPSHPVTTSNGSPGTEFYIPAPYASEYASGLIIRPSAIPAGIGLNLTVLWNSSEDWGWSVGLVQASPECTGS